MPGDLNLYREAVSLSRNAASALFSIVYTFIYVIIQQIPEKVEKSVISQKSGSELWVMASREEGEVGVRSSCRTRRHTFSGYRVTGLPGYGPLDRQGTRSDPFANLIWKDRGTPQGFCHNQPDSQP